MVIISSRLLCQRVSGLSQVFRPIHKPLTKLNSIQLIRCCSSSSDGKTLSRKDQLKRAVAQYGSTVIVFHVAISLASLGICYLIVSSGIDVLPYVEKLPLVGDQLKSNALAAGASTFVIAYAIHKVFAPVRISITLTSVPFIVRYLRAKGILKAPPTAK